MYFNLTEKSNKYNVQNLILTILYIRERNVEENKINIMLFQIKSYNAFKLINLN